jgi:hypothetical protein
MERDSVGKVRNTGGLMEIEAIDPHGTLAYQEWCDETGFDPLTREYKNPAPGVRVHFHDPTTLRGGNSW